MSPPVRNRKQRRAEGRKPPKADLESKCTMTFHQSPSTLEPSRLALLMTTMERAFSAGEKLPGVTFPVHVVVEYGGKKACGIVQPAEAMEPSMQVDEVTH